MIKKYYPLELTFGAIFYKAIQAWPNPIKCDRIIKYARSEVYSIPVLWQLGISRVEKAIPDYYNVMLLSMHDCIKYEFKRIGFSKSVLYHRDLDLNLLKKDYDARMYNNLDNVVGERECDYKQYEIDMIKNLFCRST